MNPLWRAAPTALLRFRGLFAGQLLAGALLTIAVVTGPMFLSATGNAAVDSSIASTDRFTSGFSLSITNEFLHRLGHRIAGLDFRSIDHKMDRATSSLGHVAPRVSTIISAPATATAEGDGSGAQYPVRMIARTDAVSHVARVAGSLDNPGLWIPDVVARELALSVADRMRLTANGQHVTVPVAGIYKNLINTELQPFWSTLEQQINPLSPIADPPPPLVIGSRPYVVRMAHALHQRSAFFQWDYPVATRAPVTYDDAVDLSRGFNDLQDELSDPTSSLGRSLSCVMCTHYGFPNMAFGMQSAIDAAKTQVDSLREPVTSVTAAAALVALVTIGAAAAYATSRRRAEMQLLVVRGWSPVKIGAKSGIESILPAAMGAAGGYVAALGLIAAIGPGGAITARPYLLATATIPVGLAVGFAMTSWLAARTRLTRSASERGSTWLWEVVPLGLGVAAFYWSRGGSARFSAGGGSDVKDIVLLLGVPVLLAAGVAGLAARGFRWAIGRLGSLASGLGSSAYLAARRLGSAGTILTGMLVGSVLAVGIAAYGSSMASSMRETTQAKAFVFTGGDVSIATQANYQLPKSFPFASTQAYQFSDVAHVEPSGQPIGMIGIDPRTFAPAVRWYPSFSSTPLNTMLRSLEAPSQPELPVIAVGDVSHISTIELTDASIPVHVVAHASAFPGIFGNRPWIVTDVDALSAAAQAHGGSDPVGNLDSFTPTWVRGDPERVTEALGRLGFLPTDLLTTAQVLGQPAYLAATRTFRILQAIGLASALLAAIAILLYVQARQRSRAVATALSSRMGLSRSAQMRATLIELTTMLAVAIAFGFAIGVAAAVLIHGHADPLPNLPPPPLLRISLAQLAPLLIGAVVLAGVGTAAAQLSAERTNFAEAMRHAD